MMRVKRVGMRRDRRLAVVPWTSASGTGPDPHRSRTSSPLVRLCLPAGVPLAAVRPGEPGRGRLACSAVLGATDWVDGYIARHFHQVSTSGKVLDPVADRLLLLRRRGRHPRRRRGARSGSPWLVIVREVAGGRGHPRAGGPGRPAHRRHLVRQGRHLRPDGRLPAVPRRARARWAGPTRPSALAWVAGIPGLVFSLVRRPSCTSRSARRGAARGRAGGGTEIGGPGVGSTA